MERSLLAEVCLNNRVFLSRNYRLIVSPRKCDVFKTHTCPRSEASRANMLVLRTSNFQGATIRPMVPRHEHSIVLIYCPPLNFLPRDSSKTSGIIWNFLRWKTWKLNLKYAKENRQNPPNTILIDYFLQIRLFTEKSSRASTIHPGIFRGRALWADSFSPRMNTSTSLDQFKPIRIKEI